MTDITHGVEDLPSDRAQHLLRTLIECYVRDGLPVGSRTLTRESGMNLSAATIRNVMADLEEHGFVSSPHTSAGRVPTDKGYRYFVNALLRFQPPGQSEIDELKRHFESRAGDSKALVTAASQMISSLTHLAGVVTVPREAHASLSQIEFVGLSGNRVLAILVVNGREVQNRVVQLDRHFAADELRRAAAFLNEQFGGQELAGVRARLVAQLQETREQMNRLMIDAITLAQRAFAEQPDERDADMVVAGETNLMGFRRAVERRPAAPAVRGLQREARHPAPAGPEPARRGRPDLHRPRVGLPDPGRLQRGRRPLYAGRSRGRGAGRHRADPHGL